MDSPTLAMNDIGGVKPSAVAGFPANLRIVQGAAVGAGLIGSLVLLGWLAGIEGLKSLLPGLIPMKGNAALGMTLAAAGLWLIAAEEPVPSWRSRISRVCAGLAGLLGLATLIEYSFGLDLGIDNLLFRELPGTLWTTHPGRMSAPAAGDLLALGGGIFLLDQPRGRAWAQRLSGVALAVAGIPFCGYAFDFPVLYRMGGSTPIAVHAAAGFALLASGALAARLKTDLLGEVSRKAISASFAVALATLVLVAAGVHRRLDGLVEANQGVAHAHEVMAKAAAVVGAVIDAQSGQRGIAISNHREFREGYLAASIMVRSRLDGLEAVLKDESQRRRLAELKGLILEKQVFMERVVAARHRQGKDAALALVAQGRGEMLMDSVRKAAAGFEAEERRLLRQRETAARAEVSRTLVSLVSGSALSMLMVAGCLLGLLRENERRRRGEEHVRKLNETLARHGRFFTLSVDMFCLAGTDGYFKEVGPLWEKTLGWSTEELLARPYLDLVHPEDRPATIEKASALSRGEAVVSFENRYLCKDGSYEWIQWNCLLDAGSGLIYAVARDVSDLKRVERGLREANKELDAFTYSVSHDLRAPLRAIEGFSRMLLDEHAQRLDAEGGRLLGVVRSNTARMARLIDDLLSFSRIGRKALEIGAVDMAALARSAIEDVRREKSNPALRVEMGELPPARGDRAMLGQVFANLIGNAVKYSGKKAAPAVEVGSSREGGETVYFVKDNGAGFDMKYAGKLFGVFQRLHHDDEFEGTGVGLALVERIVRRHGGRVWAEGKVGEGAVFRFTLAA